MSTLKTNKITTTAGVEVYTAKAWVNFNGTGTVAIRAAGNVSSITDTGTGNYRINFTTAMPDANYAAVFGNAWNGQRDSGTNTASTTYLDIVTGFTANLTGGGTGADQDRVQVAIFR